MVTGEQDFICGPVCAHEIAASVPGAELSLLGDCGHLVFVEQPEQFAAVVGDFLGLAPSPAA